MPDRVVHTDHHRIRLQVDPDTVELWIRTAKTGSLVEVLPLSVEKARQLGSQLAELAELADTGTTTTPDDHARQGAAP